MTYYRLLRDNKESGPFSEEEMITRGFKPYDLLWVEGKSAGWRYPSEIAAFKPYAPAVEEQPFDRFYKKQPAQASAMQPTAKLPILSNAPVAEARTESRPATAIQKTANTNMGRHIYVVLPSGRSVNLSTLADKEPDTKKVFETRPATETPVAKYIPVTPIEYNGHEQLQPGDKIASGFSEGNSAGLFLSPGDSVAAFAPSNNVSQSVLWRGLFNVETNWSLWAACAIGVATMVGLGIMIGLGISRDRHDTEFYKTISAKSSQLSRSTKPSAQASAPQAVEPLVAKPLELGTPVQGGTQKPEPAPASKSKKTNQPGSNIAVRPTEPVAESSSPLSSKDAEGSIQSVPSPAVPNPTSNAAVDAADLETKLLLQPNDFRTGAFGGISGLKYTLQNGSKLTIESVEVEVNYITANNKIYKTEKILFHDIAPGAHVTLDAPASSRGIRIKGRITRVTPKDNSVSINR